MYSLSWVLLLSMNDGKHDRDNRESLRVSMTF